MNGNTMVLFLIILAFIDSIHENHKGNELNSLGYTFYQYLKKSNHKKFIKYVYYAFVLIVSLISLLNMAMKFIYTLKSFGQLDYMYNLIVCMFPMIIVAIPLLYIEHYRRLANKEK